MNDIIDVIDKHLEKMGDKICKMQYVYDCLRKKANELYEKKLDMIMDGYSLEDINKIILKDFERFYQNIIDDVSKA